jgi:mannose-6-phosphate isomerase
MTNGEYYPLLLRAVAQEKIWGGRNLERWLDKSFAPGQWIGETWEAWDGCVIENGAHRGTTLGHLSARDAAAILGANARGKQHFPLLFKFIDAQDDLSVQVHPDDAAARALEDYPLGKTEAWYILRAEPGAALIHGFKENVDAARVTAYLDRNRLPDLLATVPVQSGDVVFVPAGTVHAIGKGIVLAEIQENSDVTYRLYDWGRGDKGRALHIEQALKVANFARATEHKIPRLTVHHAEFDQHYLVACRYFALELLDVRAPTPDLALGDKFNIVSIIGGAAEIASGRSSVAARQGQTLLLPARLGTFGIAPAPSCKILRAYTPDLRSDVIEPLLRAGYRATDIARLGGAPPQHNDLLPLL